MRGIGGIGHWQQAHPLLHLLAGAPARVGARAERRAAVVTTTTAAAAFGEVAGARRRARRHDLGPRPVAAHVLRKVKRERRLARVADEPRRVCLDEARRRVVVGDVRVHRHVVAAPKLRARVVLRRDTRVARERRVEARAARLVRRQHVERGQARQRAPLGRRRRVGAAATAAAAAAAGPPPAGARVARVKAPLVGQRRKQLGVERVDDRAQALAFCLLRGGRCIAGVVMVGVVYACWSGRCILPLQWSGGV